VGGGSGNLSRDTGYPDEVCVVFLSPPSRCQNSTSIRLSPLPSKPFPIHLSFYHSTLVYSKRRKIPLITADLPSLGISNLLPSTMVTLQLGRVVLCGKHLNDALENCSYGNSTTTYDKTVQSVYLSCTQLTVALAYT
jgi:hypothetical protein